MNIGIVTTWFPAGGGYVAKAYREILSKEHRVFIYARGGKKMKGDPNWDDADVTWAPYHYNGIKTNHLIRWAVRNKIDILFFNEQRYWKPVIEAKQAGVCIGAYVDYYKQSTVKAFGLYDFLVCNTRRHYSAFQWHTNAYYVPWGTKIKEDIPIRSNDEPIKFLVSSGWEGAYRGDRRGTLLALDAFFEVKGHCELLLYSQVPLKECLPEWRSRITRDKRVRFIEGTFEPFPYQQGDVYLYPSKLDGIGLTLPEALAHGIPAIATDSPPMNEFVYHNINGFLVKVDNYLGREDGYYWAESIINEDHLITTMQSCVDRGHTYLNDLKHSTLMNSKAKLCWIKNAEALSDYFVSSFEMIRSSSRDEILYAQNLDKTMSPTYLQKISLLIKSMIKGYLLKK